MEAEQHSKSSTPFAEPALEFIPQSVPEFVPESVPESVRQSIPELVLSVRRDFKRPVMQSSKRQLII